MDRKRSILRTFWALLVVAVVLLLWRQCGVDPNGDCTRSGGSFSDTISMSDATILQEPTESTPDDSAPSGEGEEAQTPTNNLEYVLSVEPDKSAAEDVEALLAMECPESVVVYFRQGSATLDVGYKNNAKALGRLVEMLQPYLAEGASGSCKVHISSSVSPEGSDYINDCLITSRAEAISQWIRSRFDVEIDYSLDSMGIDWQRLTSLVDNSERIPYKQEVLDILRNDSNVGVRQQRLRSLRGGVPYAYIYRNFYPYLRYAAAHIEHHEQTPAEEPELETEVVVPEPEQEVVVPEQEEEEVPKESAEQPEPEAEPEQQPEQPTKDAVAEPQPEESTEESTEEPTEEPAPAPQPEKRHFEPLPLYGALKTNALYDLALIPNIGAELMVGDHFSIGANWHWAWWSIRPFNWFWRTYGGDVSARYWFGERSDDNHFAGHHVGIYGQIVTYDFMSGKRGILADRWSWDAGVEYGYSMPLAEHLNIDFTLGVGYHTGLFYEYMEIDDHYVWQATKRRQYFGPTKLEVSLVWHFDTKQTKGGGR